MIGNIFSVAIWLLDQLVLSLISLIEFINRHTSTVIGTILSVVAILWIILLLFVFARIACC